MLLCDFHSFIKESYLLTYLLTYTAADVGVQYKGCRGLLRVVGAEGYIFLVVLNTTRQVVVISVILWCLRIS